MPEEGYEMLTRFSTGILVLDSEAVCPDSGVLPRVAARWSLVHFGGGRELKLRNHTYVYSESHVVPFRTARDAWVAIDEPTSSRYTNDEEAERGELTPDSIEFYLE